MNKWALIEPLFPGIKVARIGLMIAG